MPREPSPIDSRSLYLTRVNDDDTNFADFCAAIRAYLLGISNSCIVDDLSISVAVDALQM
jgi:hypothetical protein